MKTYTYDTIIIGSGAAGYNAACRLKQLGKNTAIVTEAVNCGTSRNTGSDKQTYYKLGLGGSTSDSVYNMAQNLFDGGCVDGDNALCEAALSARCFMNLAELGVPFPMNRYGEYIGYKTDHDPFARATSAGPLTSKFMTEALQKKAEELSVPVFSGYLAVEILKHKEKVCGVLCVEIKCGELCAFRCGDIVLATGGPAGIYADSVYPACHTGASSLAILAGAKMQNLTEWQYGLASKNPRWNVSGTYMQVLPRFVSVDAVGNEYEFLEDFFEDKFEALSLVFLKGYQWPFDSKKVLSGSSVIDLLVYRECVIKQRCVYLDFTKNPFGMEEIEFHKLSNEAYGYLSRADACFGKPIERLFKMNAPAVELYKSKGVDITNTHLEIALCAQHHNGGIAVDAWWQTTLPGLFAVGECAGTHGITRPGGSALNAGQVGSLRAAQYISEYGNECISESEFADVLQCAEKTHNAISQAVVSNKDVVRDKMIATQRRMSDNAAAIRNPERMRLALDKTNEDINNIFSFKVSGLDKIYNFYKLRDILTTQKAVLMAMIDYAETIGNTRGSALYTDECGELREGLEEVFRFCAEDEKNRNRVQELQINEESFKAGWRPVRRIPQENEVFETIWRSYRENGNIY